MGGKTSKDKISEIFKNKNKITHAIGQGIHEALLCHKRAGNPVASWKDGKIVWIPSEDIPVDKS
jgi:hypothetical protein